MYELIPRIQCCYAPCVLPYISLLHKRPIWCMYTLKLYLFSWVIILSVCSIYFLYVLAMFNKLCSQETVTFHFRMFPSGCTRVVAAKAEVSCHQGSLSPRLPHLAIALDGLLSLHSASRFCKKLAIHSLVFASSSP